MSDEESFNLSESDDGDFSASEEEYVPGKDSGADSDSDEEIEPSESSQESEDDERVIADNKKKRPPAKRNNKRGSLSSSFRHSTINKYREAAKNFANNPNVSNNLKEILQRSQFTKKKTLGQSQKSREATQDNAPNFDCNAGLRLSDSDSDEDEPSLLKIPVKSFEKPATSEPKPSTSAAIETPSNQLNMAQIMENLRETEKVQEQLKSIQGKSLEPSKKIDDLNVSQLLALGESIGSKKRSQNVLSESDSEWEDVEEHREKAEQQSNVQIPHKGIEITINPFGDRSKKTPKEVDVEMQMRRKFNKQRKDYQVFLHKTNLMMWIGHGNYVNPILNNTSLMQMTLAMLPKNNNFCYPKEKTDCKYFKQISDWFRGQIALRNREMYCKLEKRPPLLTSLALQIKTKQAICRRDFILIFIILLRAIGIQCRMVMNLNLAPLRPPQSELLSLSTKGDTKKKEKDDDEEGSISKYKKKSSSKSSKSSKETSKSSKSSKSSSKDSKRSSKSSSKKTSAANKENLLLNVSKVACRTRSKTVLASPIPQMDGLDDLPKKPARSVRIKALKGFEVSINQSYVNMSSDEGSPRPSTSKQAAKAGMKRPKPVEAPIATKKLRSGSKSETRNGESSESAKKVERTESTKENSTPEKANEKSEKPKLANLRSLSRKSVHFSASTDEKDKKKNAEKPNEVEKTKEAEKSKGAEKSEEVKKKTGKFDKLKQHKKSDESGNSKSPVKSDKVEKLDKPGTSKEENAKRSAFNKLLDNSYKNEKSSENSGKSPEKSSGKTEKSPEKSSEKIGKSSENVGKNSGKTTEKASEKSINNAEKSSEKPGKSSEKPGKSSEKPGKSSESKKSDSMKRSSVQTKEDGNAKKSRIDPKKSKAKPKVEEDEEFMEDSGSSDEDFEVAEPKKKSSNKRGTIDRRVLSTDLDESVTDKDEKSKRQGIDIWVELYSEADEKWVPVDVFKGKVGSLPELCKAASHPLTYVFAWNNDNSVKDVSPRYCPNINTTTRKLRVEAEYLTSILKQFKGPRAARDRKEDGEFAQLMMAQELPTSISDFKNHPLYALKRHLLKFEGIYPPDVPTLGFIRDEPIYPRDAVFTLHSREIWVKQAKVVKAFEKPYKIVTARPKWDRATNSCIKDIPLELFGIWQTQDYEPPTAENGVVPRNAYGNVELFKPTMLPKKTVHIQLPGLNKVCKKLNIDCAQAVVGFDFNGGYSHPVFDGFVVCEEFAEKVIDAWNREQDEVERREEEKREKRVLDNWKKLIKGLLIKEKLKNKYNF